MKSISKCCNLWEIKIEPDETELMAINWNGEAKACDKKSLICLKEGDAEKAWKAREWKWKKGISQQINAKGYSHIIN